MERNLICPIEKVHAHETSAASKNKKRRPRLDGPRLASVLRLFFPALLWAGRCGQEARPVYLARASAAARLPFGALANRLLIGEGRLLASLRPRRTLVNLAKLGGPSCWLQVASYELPVASWHELSWLVTCNR